MTGKGEAADRTRGVFFGFRASIAYMGGREMKTWICTAVGLIGAWIAALFGGWDTGLITLVIFMVIDYVSGLIVAGVFHKSKKTKSGTLESRAGWKGLARKCMTLLFVLIAYRLDLMIGTDYVRDAVIIGFVTNETISIIENAGLMGIPLPGMIQKAIDVLVKKAGEVPILNSSDGGDESG